MYHYYTNISFIVAKSKNINLYFDEFADFTIYFKDGDVRNYRGHLPKYADKFFENHTCYISKVNRTLYRVYVQYIPNWKNHDGVREAYLDRVHAKYPVLQG